MTETKEQLEQSVNGLAVELAEAALALDHGDGTPFDEYEDVYTYLSERFLEVAPLKHLGIGEIVEMTVVATTGGPHIEADLVRGRVEGSWGTDMARAHFDGADILFDHYASFFEGM